MRFKGSLDTTNIIEEGARLAVDRSLPQDGGRAPIRSCADYVPKQVWNARTMHARAAGPAPGGRPRCQVARPSLHPKTHAGSRSSLCTGCARLASGIPPVQSGPCPTFAHRADGNSFWRSDLRPIVTDLRPHPSGLCAVPAASRRGFDFRRLHHRTRDPAPSSACKLPDYRDLSPHSLEHRGRALRSGRVRGTSEESSGRRRRARPRRRCRRGPSRRSSP